MKIELFVLCDFAADYGGKLLVNGVFDTILVKQMPAVHPHCSIAARIRFDLNEQGQKNVTFTLADAAGQTLLPPADLVINVVVVAGRESATAHLVANIGGLTISHAGEYSVKLSIGGIEQAAIPFWVSIS